MRSYWLDDDMWLGYLDEFLDYMTQGESLEELKENLKDIYKELTGGQIPAVRHHAELNVLWREGIWLQNLRKWDVLWFVTVENMIGIKIQKQKFLSQSHVIVKLKSIWKHIIKELS